VAEAGTTVVTAFTPSFGTTRSYHFRRSVSEAGSLATWVQDDVASAVDQLLLCYRGRVSDLWARVGAAARAVADQAGERQIELLLAKPFPTFSTISARVSAAASQVSMPLSRATMRPCADRGAAQVVADLASIDVGSMEQRRSHTWATVLIDARFVPIVRDHFGRHCHTDGEADDGRRARVRLAAPTPLDIARNLAGWGAMVEVLEPPSVQTELARIGAELAAGYPKGR
jgi:WYL domain